MASLAGRTALVTGASRGIGRCVVERFAAEGARVWALARSAEALASLSSETGATPLVADVTDDASLWSSLDELQDVAGPPHVVVNAAGVFGVETCAAETVRGFDRQIATNLRGPFLVNRALLPRMLERGSGILVNIGSVAGRKAFPGNAAYAASKFGLRGYHEVLVEELRGTGVCASLVEPAATDTALWDPLDPDTDPALPDRSAMLDADDVAAAVLFVATRPDGVAIPSLRVERG
jgi:NADP-dependent 3-hydroxy acid dehydrogenase YdfG